MGKMGWGEVDKPREYGDSRFLSIEAGETVTLRILDEIPYTHFVHHVSQQVDGEEVFRSVPQTADPDDDYIDAHTNRYPAKPRHCLRVVLFDDDGEPQGIRILEGGTQIFSPLKEMYEKHDTVTEYDVNVTRKGKGRETSYMVTASPRSYDLDVEEWQEKLEEDEWDWDRLFPPITPEDQKKMIDEAKIDITYDPAAELAAVMDVDEALDVHFGFGKYGPDNYPPKGLPVGEVLEIDAGYITWAAENVTSDDTLAAACRVTVDNLDQISSGAPKEKLKGKTSKPKEKKSAKKKKAPEPEPEPEEDEEESEGPTRDDWSMKASVEDYLARWYGKNGKKVALALAILESEGLEWDAESNEAVPIGEAGEPEEDEEEEPEEDDEEEVEEDDDEDMSREDLQDEIMTIFQEIPKFEDPMEIIKIVKKYGDGSKKLRDLSMEQLRKLYMALSVME